MPGCHASAPSTASSSRCTGETILHRISMRPEWASVHQDELRGNWDRAGAHEPLLPIDPLP